jgi:segregation and condensation protein B
VKTTRIVEALLFASETPLHPSEIARASDTLDVAAVESAIEELRGEYERDERAVQIYKLGDGYQILTRPEYAPYLERFDSIPKVSRLSQAALETLAIIVYRQPVSRIEIDEIRGVNSGPVLRTLQERELIEVVGRAEGLGRPLLYGTTARFLEHFGLQGLKDLPQPEDLAITLDRR